jgi:hypothetical protein
MFETNGREETDALPDVLDSPRLMLTAIRFLVPWGGNFNVPLQLRKNKKESLPYPEWNPGILMDDSCAAYRTQLPEGKNPNRVLIEAVFQLEGREYAEAEVRTISARSSTNVLGEVRPTTIRVTAGEEVLQPLLLRDTDLATRGVGRFAICWQWQYRFPGEDWQNLALSEHRIYTILGMPSLPWLQCPCESDSLVPAPNIPELPWTELLDIVCCWAWGAQTADEAAMMIALALFRLGQTYFTPFDPHPILRYHGNTFYTTLGRYDTTTERLFQGFFRLTELIARIKGDKNAPDRVNCADCATILSVFANAVGADLEQVIICARDSFTLNPVLLIGAPPDAWKTKSFQLHEVAWKGPRSFEGRVFDACLGLDADSNPTTLGRLGSVHSFSLAVGLPFGEPSDSRSYLYQLVDPSARWRMRILPPTRRRALQQESLLIQAEDLSPYYFPHGYLADLSWRDTNRLKSSDGEPEELFIWEYEPPIANLDDWRGAVTVQFPACQWAKAVQIDWNLGQLAARTTIYECSSRQAAHDLLWQMLQEIETLELRNRLELEFADIVFGDGYTFLLFARANVIFKVEALDGDSVPILELGQKLDADLTSKPPNAVVGSVDVRPYKSSELVSRLDTIVPFKLVSDSGRPRYHKFFSRKGYVVRKQHIPHLILPSSGNYPVEVYAINRHGPVVDMFSVQA